MGNDIVLQELDSGKNHHIALPCVIGRGEEVDLALADPAISHRHAMIEKIDDELWIRDYRSANGVFVNGKRIEGKMRLNLGDLVQLAQKEFRVLEREEDLAVKTVILHTLPREGEIGLDHRRLKLIHEITTEWVVSPDLMELGKKVFSKFREVFEQDRGYIALFREDGSLEPLYFDSVSGSIPVSRSILNRLFQTGESFLLQDALQEDSFKEEESIVALRIRCALCVPLIYHQQIYGLIYVDRDVPGYYKEEDLEFLKTIGSILAPLIENARLWAELKRHFDKASVTLRQTEARLIEMERQAAYVRLAQAMAHEIRNPLMVIGGYVRRLARLDAEVEKAHAFQMIRSSVERVEMVLKEVDQSLNNPPPQRKLERIDHLIEEEMGEWAKRVRLSLSVRTHRVMIPLDSGLFKKALSMIFKEILFGVPPDTELPIILQDEGDEIEILFGTLEGESRLYEVFDPQLQEKPLSFSLFLNIAHKIISDHQGKLLLTPEKNNIFPVVVRLPRKIGV